MYAIQKVLVTFEHFDLESAMQDSTCFDSVTVCDGSSLNNASRVFTYCGSTEPPEFLSSSNVALVLFHTDSTNVFTGFRASYSSKKLPPATAGQWYQSREAVALFKVALRFWLLPCHPHHAGRGKAVKFVISLVLKDCCFALSALLLKFKLHLFDLLLCSYSLTVMPGLILWCFLKTLLNCTIYPRRTKIDWLTGWLSSCETCCRLQQIHNKSNKWSLSLSHQDRLSKPNSNFFGILWPLINATVKLFPGDRMNIWKLQPLNLPETIRILLCLMCKQRDISTITDH